MKHSDLSNLHLPPAEIQAIQLYQQGKLFESEHAIHFNKKASNLVSLFFIESIQNSKLIICIDNN